MIVGAGAFGGWTALWLRRAGAEVTLVDAWGPGNSRASSGGETRLIRASYGPRRVYSAMVARALEIWKEHQARWDDRLFFPVGMLRMSSGESEYAKAAVPILRDLGLSVEEFDGDELARRFPQINPEGLSYALFERDAGYLLARRGCERVLRDFLAEGGSFLQAGGGTGKGRRWADAGHPPFRRRDRRGRPLRVRLRPVARPPLSRVRPSAGAAHPPGGLLLRSAGGLFRT